MLEFLKVMDELLVKKKDAAADNSGRKRRKTSDLRTQERQSLSDRRSVSEKAPLQDRFSERVRARRPRIQFGDRGVVLADKRIALVSRISDRGENPEIVTN